MLISSSRTRSVASGAVGSPAQAASATSSARRSRARDGRLDARRGRGGRRRRRGRPRPGRPRAASGSSSRRHLLARSARSAVASPSGPAPRMLRETLTTVSADATPNSAGTSAISRTLCAESGREDRERRPRCVRRRSRSRRVAPSRRARPRSTRARRGRRRRSRTSATTPAATVRPSPRTARCVAAASGLEVAASTNTPLPARRARVEHAVERAEALIGDRGHRVGLERRARRQPGLAVGIDGRADVAALGVGDHEQPGGARGGEHVLERRVAGRPVPLEERHLRLHDARPAGRRIHDPQPELAGAGRGVGQPPLRAAAPRAGRSRRRAGRRPRRPRQPDRRTPRPRCLTRAPACPRDRARTPAGCARRTSPRTTSNAATAAPSCAIVVNSGLSAATAAARIS